MGFSHVAGYGVCQLTHMHTDICTVLGALKSVLLATQVLQIFRGDSMDCSLRQRHTLQRNFCRSLLNIYFHASRPKIFLYIGCLKVIVACSINYVYVVHRNI